jgi:beta-lactamase regulating signal transducer with metallopeptidase domain
MGVNEQTMTPLIQLDSIAQLSAVRIVDCLVEGTIIAAFAGLASRFAARQGSGTKFAIWFSALMATAVTPLLTGFAGLHNEGSGASHASITLPSSWAIYLFGSWAVVAVWMLARIGMGLWQLRSLRRTFSTVDLSRLDASVRETLGRNSAGRSISLCTSDRVQVPAAIGLFRPVVVVPTWLIDELSEDELNQVLLHELAHLRRRDDWTNLVQKIVKALFFFHPAVWWIEKKVSLEREMACDDAVLAETARPRAYAECLTRLAEKTLVRRSIALAQAALGRIRQTSMRVTQILDPKRSTRKAQAWKLALPMAGMLVVCGAITAKEPQLIAFRDVPVQAQAEVAMAPNPALLRPASLRIADNANSRPIARVHSRHIVAHELAGPVKLPPTQAAKEDNPLLPNLQMERPPLLHLATFDLTQMISAEAFFVVFENPNGFGRPVYEIQIWQMTVIHPARSSQIPHKI